MHTLEKLFQNISSAEHSPDLYQKITTLILRKRQRQEQIQLILTGGLSLLSGVGVIFAFRYVIQELSHSNFSQYISLLFHDSTTALVYWRELGMSLAESLPFLGVTILLSTILLFLASLKLVSEKHVHTSIHFNRFI